MNNRHKWNKEIKAWADGAEIEIKYLEAAGSKSGWFVTSCPDWDYSGAEFRIKPQPKEPKYLYVYQKNGGYELGGEPHPAQQYYPIVGKIKLEVQDG